MAQIQLKTSDVALAAQRAMAALKRRAIISERISAREEEEESPHEKKERRFFERVLMLCESNQSELIFIDGWEFTMLAEYLPEQPQPQALPVASYAYCGLQSDMGTLPALFKAESFVSHAGLQLDWKIVEEGLTDESIDTIAGILAKKIFFRQVISVPRGGDRLALALQQYEGIQRERGVDVLVAEDVLTTGSSLLRRMREVEQAGKLVDGKESLVGGVVIFARGKVPQGISAFLHVDEIFQ